MKREKRTFFARRMAAFIIDFAIIYALAFITYNILQQFAMFLSMIHLILFIALVYYPIATFAFKASIGKKLWGLSVISNGQSNYLKSILIREIICKQLIIILPISLFVSLVKLEWLSPYIEVLCTIVLIIILLIYFLFMKRTWYDQLAQTIVVENTSINRVNVNKDLLVLVAICIIVFGLRTFNYLSTGSFNGNFIPQHTNNITEPYVSFLKTQKNAKDYIFELFEKNDIVILCEGAHPEMVQYEFIINLVSDNRFINNVGNVFSEVGTVNQQAKLDSLLFNGQLEEDVFENELIDLLRNYSCFPIWDNTNYYNYFKSLYAINKVLPESKKIKHFFTDLECDWNLIKNQDDYHSLIKSRFRHRDKLMANHIISNYESMLDAKQERHKCLVIMNSRHAVGAISNETQIGDIGESCASCIIKKFPDKTANVLINTVKYDLGLSLPDFPPFIVPAQVSPINNGVWDNAFAEFGNKSVGFNLNDSPFGKDRFDLFFFPSWKRYFYQNVFTGFVFYKPLASHYFSFGFKNIIHNDFDNEIIARAKRINDDAIDNNLAYWTFKVNQLRDQEVMIDHHPYQQIESVFELIFGTLILLFGLLSGFIALLKG